MKYWIHVAVLGFALWADFGNASSLIEDIGQKNVGWKNVLFKFNTTRVVGGTWAKRGVYPYQTAIFVNDSFTCGGTLLDTQRHVLTAAHCLTLVTRNIQLLTLYFRTTVLNPPDSNYIERNASQAVIHHNYNDTSFDNDIGVITLAEPVEGVRPVRLETDRSVNESYIGKEATVVGWGRTRQVLHPASSSGPPSNNLRHVNLTIVGERDCSILYYDDNLFTDGKRLCASTLFGKSMCQGDSGGPLLINGIQIGINSAAAGCADPRYPAIFLRVSSFAEWIKNHTQMDEVPRNL